MKTIQKKIILKIMVFSIYLVHFIFSGYQVSKKISGTEIDFGQIALLIVLGLILVKLSLEFRERREFTEEMQAKFEKVFIQRIVICGIVFILSILLRVYLLPSI